MEPVDTMGVNRTMGVNSSARRMMSFDEDTVIRRCYQRNNRKGGQKNLRCFPNCCAGVHASTGYCGGPIVVHLTHPSLPATGADDYLLVAEFCPVVNGTPEGSLRDGDVWPLSKAVAMAEKEKNPLLPLFQGAPMEGTPQSYCFNASKKGWHYGFVSNKHVSEMHHVLMVYLLEKRGTSDVAVVDTLVSISFSIYCRRRAKTSRLGELLAADPLVAADERKRKDPAAEVPKVRPPSRSSDTDWLILNELLQDTARPPIDDDPPSSSESSQEDEDLQTIKRLKLPPTAIKEEVTSPSTSPADATEFVAPPGFYSVAQVKAALGIADVFKFPPKNLRSVECVAKASASATSTVTSTATSTVTSTAKSSASAPRAAVSFASPMRSFDPQREFTQSAPHLSSRTHRRVRGTDLHEALSQSTPSAPHQVHRPVASPLRHRSQSALHTYSGPYFSNPAQQMMFQQQQSYMFQPFGSFNPSMLAMQGTPMGYPMFDPSMAYGFQQQQQQHMQHAAFSRMNSTPMSTPSSAAFTRMNSTPMSTPSSTASPYQSPQPYAAGSSTPSPVYTTPPPYSFPSGPDPSAPSMTILEELLLEDDSCQMAVPYPAREVATAYYQRQDTSTSVTPCLPLDLKPAPAPAPAMAPARAPVAAPVAASSREREASVVPTEIVVTPRGRTARVHLGRGNVSPTGHARASASSASPVRHLSINMDELMSSRSIYLRMGSPSQPSFVRIVPSSKKKRRRRRRRNSSEDDEDDEDDDARATAVVPAKRSGLLALVGNHCNLILKALAFVTLCVVLVYYTTHVAQGGRPEEPVQATPAETHAVGSSGNGTDSKIS
ncbi:hypothetical protein ACHHYP_02883 [Achlya hypogyna]|uniref:Uncharacterized protein n=1 Tax=Achlya hypogyna TaxID=1202772 RepID=A0A1V9ZRJ7_ACHHY|nr:hypothetical protein ACHHYP_02883 [Achlya hypogyna]